ncbi:hypothetical protein [Cronobacter dublinensis]|uniref:hypothetical protein n=1 Tax=Cronobacter dublinensis TaxID=413497 RepID=UPI00051925F0|nr:hypothetical protein [Cronobacter dublinensis]MDI6439619.1 hypothetical protein [Cronobacter dublinensis]NCH96472.1 hypothetical protein [Cronobacter dublinensis]
MPRGIISGRNYTEQDIFDVVLYPRMKEEPLLNDDDCIVVPVRKEGAPHFRRIGTPSFGRRLGRAENNQTHDNCVNFLHEQLSNPENERITFSTYIFDDNGKYEEQVIFSPMQDSNYAWYSEADARIAFADESYIQPDIGGRDINKFFPRSAYPNIVIEVVRTHHPDKETFQKLFELSKANHHVYFYFINEGNRISVLNGISACNNSLKIRVSHYLIGGQLYKNGSAYAPRKENEPFEKWYDFLKNTYFTNAKDRA